MAEKLNLIDNLSSQSTKDSTGGASSTLKYPRDIFDGSTDYVKFQFYKYKGPFSGNRGNNGEQVDPSGNTIPQDFSRYNQAGADFEVYDDKTKNIIFYMPEDISTGYGSDWGAKDFSNIGAEMLRSGGSALSGDLGGTVGAVGNLIKNAMGALPTAGAEALANAINATGAGQVTTNDVIGGSLGVILNPNTELMFNGFKMRNFGLKFKMAPRNKKEAETMRAIIGEFKRVSLPTFGTNAGGLLDLSGNFKTLIGADKPANASEESSFNYSTNANYIGVPGLCQVKFMKGSKLHPYLPQYKVCAITNVDVNYTPDGVYATYFDEGAPVAVELSLSFAETKLVYSNDIVTNGASF